MADSALKRFEDLISQGTQLVPLGGFEHSGYNARLQPKYLEWRKHCLELLDQIGPIGFPYKNKILGDANGGFFFQPSAQLILNQMKDVYEKLKVSPELAVSAETAKPSTEQRPSGVTVSETSGARVLKPPPKREGAVSAPKPAASTGVGRKVYVVGEENDALKQQLSQFLQEIGLEEVTLRREHGKMLALDAIRHDDSIKCAFFVFNSDDVTFAMFELGHFVGKIGAGRVIVLHMTDVDFPRNVPGVSVKPIVVKLEEASLSIIKELKSLGYQISL